MTVQQQLLDLPYDYNALEPVISAEIMELHYSKHHRAYVNNLNAALEKYADAESKGDLSALISLQQAIRFNGGGHINHTIFWNNLIPESQALGAPQGDLLAAIQQEFGSFDQFVEKFSAMTVAIQGSGWGWLGYIKEKNRLVVTTTANQDPLVTQGAIPLLGVDVWEHAYYLQYRNGRNEYVKNIWRIVNWKDVSARLAKAKG